MQTGLQHSAARRQHTIRRLFERHGIVITNSEYDALCRLIESGEGRRIGPGRAGGVVYAVPLRGRSVHAVWSTGNREIMTVLPGAAS